MVKSHKKTHPIKTQKFTNGRVIKNKNLIK